MRQHLWPVVMLACLSLAGCSPPRSALIGTWRADLKMGTNLLTLNGDGTFRLAKKSRFVTPQAPSEQCQEQERGNTTRRDLEGFSSETV